MRHFICFNDSVRGRVSSPDPPGASESTRGLLYPTAEVFVSAVLERGSYPFPFRTRKSSLPSPMVPGPRARESRAPLDSRPLDGKPSRGLFLYTARHNPAGFFCARVSSRTSWDCRGLFIPACHLVRMRCYPFFQRFGSTVRVGSPDPRSFRALAIAKKV